MIGRSSLFAKNAISTFVRNSSHGGFPGANLPFDINNRFKLTGLFIVFFGSAFGAPFLVLRHQLTKA
ncbi:cytochrome c oxidase subunit 7C, mitochondrial-like [Anthonomus grandis grandis]|uniref:cytochrome c oxidase subunit 7C, mitochondrial-like n=1 Tax=Anthonomus grandis grandis TaxID=2921223 RepID=UPI0021660050|nr:cytochrome c oxidase subunit 7C, mitochondrial-like [Anthonomus grandis grandis]